MEMRVQGCCVYAVILADTTIQTVTTHERKQKLRPSGPEFFSWHLLSVGHVSVATGRPLPPMIFHASQPRFPARVPTPQPSTLGGPLPCHDAVAGPHPSRGCRVQRQNVPR
jgi:hypothetical protein